MLAILSPGQGSQTPGMLQPWLTDASKKLLDSWSLHIDLDLARLGTTASAEKIKDTANAQPLIVAAGLLGFEALSSSDQLNFYLAAGHSVGEITASAISEVLDATSALELVRQRGLSMAKAASQAETGMSAVLGGDRDDVLKTIERYELVAANDNGAGQIVAAGSLQNLEKFATTPPAGARIRPLAVAGAFHTHYMSSAVDDVSSLATKLSIHDPKVKLLSNKDGNLVINGKDAINRIVNQIANPVRWDLCMNAMAELGITGVIELPPASTLVGLLKRAVPNIETFALKSPDEIPAAREFVEKHSEKHGGA